MRKVRGPREAREGLLGGLGREQELDVEICPIGVRQGRFLRSLSRLETEASPDWESLDIYS